MTDHGLTPQKIHGVKWHLNEYVLFKPLEGHRLRPAPAHLISDLRQEKWLLRDVEVDISSRCRSLCAAPIARHFHTPFVPVFLA